MRHSVLLVLLVAALVTAACSTSGVVGTSQLAAILSSYLDPTGDAAAQTTAGTAYDVVKVVSQRIDSSPFGSYDTLRTEITFDGATPPGLPAPGSFPAAAGELAFRVYFDTDQDVATGGWTNGMCGNVGGVEFMVDGTTAADAFGSSTTGRQANGNYQVVDSAGTVVGEATVSAVGNVLTVNAPLAALSDDGQTYMSVRVGNGTDPTTDCGPHTAGAIITREGAKDKR